MNEEQGTMVDLTDAEYSWNLKWLKQLKRVPAGLDLIIDAAGDGSVSVLIDEDCAVNRSQKGWIRKMHDHLAAFPEDGIAWVLANVDGWNIGSGTPEFHTGTTVGSGGAMGSSTDNFSQHYIDGFDVDYGDVPESKDVVAEFMSPGQHLNSIVRPCRC